MIRRPSVRLSAAMMLITPVLIFLMVGSGARAQSAPARRGIALTYANDQLMDGAGAQLQRIYAIYALSRFMHLPYVHTGLKQIGYQGLSALEANKLAPDLQDRYNRIFVIPSDIQLPPNVVVKYFDTPEFADIERLESQAMTDNQFYLLKIKIPYLVTDKDPEMYQCLKQISPFHPAPSDTFRIAIHVRRGEEFAVESQRMLPNSYYLATTQTLIAALKKLHIPFVCELYTEVARKAFTVTGQTHGLEGMVSHPVVIDPKMNNLQDFDVLPNLQKFINTDAIDTLRGMATADALIISRSSFSYFAALFNNGIVVYYPFWHKPEKQWLISDMQGKLDPVELNRELTAWKKAHQASKGKS